LLSFDIRLRFCELRASGALSSESMARLFPLSFLLATVTLASLAQQPDHPKLAEVFAAAQRSGNFDGVAVITIVGKTVFTSGLGFSDRKAKTPMGPETLFRLGSLTKQVTTLLVMRQVSGRPHPARPDGGQHFEIAAGKFGAGHDPSASKPRIRAAEPE
jgi:hypothetical protein